MSGIGYPRNKLIVVEILRSASVHGDGSESNVFFNGRIREVKDITDRQRLNFYRKKGRFHTATNIDRSHLLKDLEKTLTDCVTYRLHVLEEKGRK
jgi:hypothetical protein